MTIEEIANKLNECGNGHCAVCKYLYVDSPEECKTMLIHEMGAEAKKLSEKMLDDRKWETMTIIMIEATAEELSANRTVMDSVNDVLTRFADKLCGVNKIDYSKLAAYIEDMKETELGDNDA